VGLGKEFWVGEVIWLWGRQVGFGKGFKVVEEKVLGG
jgi:hypothetical protein